MNTEEDNDDTVDTEISASLASLDVTVKTEGQQECEELFYRVWNHTTQDAEEMSQAMRDRFSGPG